MASKRLKADAIINLIKGFQNGTKKAVLAKKLGVSKHQVSKWYKRWDNGIALLTLDNQLEITSTYGIGPIEGAIGF